MLIHVVVRALVSHTPVLTYRTSTDVAVGQLVLVPLRGRSIPGIVVKNNVSADTTAAIQPVRAIGSTILPVNYIDTITALAEYYGVLPGHVFSQVGAALTRPYLTSKLAILSAKQECFVTPAHTTPLARALTPTTQTVPTDAAARRQQWQQAAAGHPLRLLGGLAAVTLPFRSLKEVVLDAPFSSPYRSNRSPGINTAVVSCITAQTTGAQLTIRTPLPLEIFRSVLPLPPKTRVVCPQLQTITAAPLGTRSYINTELIDTILEQRRAQKRVLVYINRLPKHNGGAFGVESIALDLQKRLGGVVDVIQKGSAPSTADLTVATSHALYEHNLTWDFAVIISLEGLVSPHQPHSPLAAVETIAALASRSPVYAQYRDVEHPLVQAVMAQLNPDSLRQLTVFTKRLLTVRFSKTTSEATNAYRAELCAMWPNWLADASRKTMTFMIEHTLTPPQRALLAQRPRGVRLLTDNDTLPSNHPLDGAQTAR